MTTIREDLTAYAQALDPSVSVVIACRDEHFRYTQFVVRLAPMHGRHPVGCAGLYDAMSPTISTGHQDVAEHAIVKAALHEAQQDRKILRGDWLNDG